MKHASVYLLLLLAACGGSDGKTDAAKPQTAAQLEAAKEAAKPDTPEAIAADYVRKALAAEKQGDYLAAAAYRGAAVDLLPDDRQLLREFIVVAGRAEMRDKTVNALARYASQHPDDTAMNVELGAALLSAKKNAPAREVLAPLCADQGSDWQTCSLAGVAEDRLRNFKQAEINYRRALRRAPDHPVVLNNYALSLYAAGNKPGAAKIARKLLARPDLSPNMAEVMQRIVAESN